MPSYKCVLLLASAKGIFIIFYWFYFKRGGSTLLIIVGQAISIGSNLKLLLLFIENPLFYWSSHLALESKMQGSKSENGNFHCLFGYSMGLPRDNLSRWPKWRSKFYCASIMINFMQMVLFHFLELEVQGIKWKFPFSLLFHGITKRQFVSMANMNYFKFYCKYKNVGLD